VTVGERDAAVDVGVALDPEFAPVVHPMVSGAQGDEVPGVGGSVVFPVDDVVDLEVVGLVAAGDGAGLVAAQHDEAGALRDHALCATDRNRHVVSEEHGREQPVAGDVLADRVGQGPPACVAGARVGVEVDVDAEPVASCRRLDGVE